MSNTKIQTLAEPMTGITFAQGLAFLERTRRQIDRFDELPHAPGVGIAASDEAEIRQLCDELESDIRRSLSGD